MRKLFVLICILMFSSAQASKSNAVKLFHIEKSTNDNIVVYEAVMDGEYIDPGSPLEMYWIEEGSVITQLTWLEKKMAYGVKYSSQVAGQRYEFHIIALPQKKVILTANDGRPQAITEIAGSQAVLDKVYVELTGSGLTSNIKYIELTGVALDTHEVITERLIK